jgi:hypothetical protein
MSPLNFVSLPRWLASFHLHALGLFVLAAARGLVRLSPLGSLVLAAELVRMSPLGFVVLAAARARPDARVPGRSPLGRPTEAGAGNYSL